MVASVGDMQSGARGYMNSGYLMLVKTLARGIQHGDLTTHKVLVIVVSHQMELMVAKLAMLVDMEVPPVHKQAQQQ